MKNKTEQRGFTLVELMIVIAILGIIATIGSTSVLNSLPTMRLKSAARDVFSTMMRAKVEATRRGENVTVLFNTPPNGYTMFIDNLAGLANIGVLNAGETVLFTQPALPNGVSFGPVDLNNNGDFIDPGEVAGAVSFAKNALVFSPRGIPIDATTGSFPLVLIGVNNIDQGAGLLARDSAGNILRRRSVTVSSAGRIRIN